ncbi:cupin domain-containing protein [Salibacter halophilus]|uniref:Cupin domain-containing protein n=1 Tax=Salibacter halophilus TaxID=1803916 RepID=A0A6N6MCI9_9FLAO|nr:cupin domain-containing protein [Salibacter halophilus]KAB1065108.1 cupin domain-containing protein [Salibacter halophilus]
METHFGLNYHETAETTNGRFFLATSNIPSDDPGTPWHLHSKEDEWVLIFSGALKVCVSDEEYLLKSGDHLKIPKASWHRWSPVKNFSSHVMFLFSPAGIEDMFREWDQIHGEIEDVGMKYGTAILK